MKIQSLSVVVPNKNCVNRCPFCVSRMVNSDIYPNKMDLNDPHYDINVREYLKRMQYVANLGCNTVMLTGTSEPQQNKHFLATFALLHQQLGSPFTNIEMQTTGLFLTNNRNYLRFLRNFVGVNTVAISINSFDDNENNKILGHNLKDVGVYLKRFCDNLIDYDFNIRLCCNLNRSFNNLDTAVKFYDFLRYCKDELHANQITFRKLYVSDDTTPQGEWIKNNMFTQYELLTSCMHAFPVIGTTPYGINIRNCHDMSVICDNDCMGKSPTTDVLKYLILRPNCKLYSSWDSPASLVC